MTRPWRPSNAEGMWTSTPVLIGLAVVVGLLATSAVRILRRELAIRRERAAVERKIEELVAEKKRLEESLSALGSPQAVERLAKERLNLKNPGEEVVVVTPGRGAATATDSRANRWHEFLPRWLTELVNFLGR